MVEGAARTLGPELWVLGAGMLRNKGAARIRAKKPHNDVGNLTYEHGQSARRSGSGALPYSTRAQVRGSCT